MQTFKQPLSKEEELFYLKRSKAGDLEARNILVEYNLRLVAHIIKKYNNLDRDIDDLLSIGTIGLIKAINTFDIDKGSRLATYASRCIENELLMMLRQERKCSKEFSLYDPIGTKRELEIILLRYGLPDAAPHTQREVAKAMNISRSYVSRIEKKALSKLRCCFDSAQS